LFVVFVLPAPVIAQFEIGLAGNVEYIENPLRSALSDGSDVLSLLLLGVQFERETKNFTTQFNYSANRLEYSRDFLSDQTVVDGTGSLTWNMVPDLFNWSISNTRSNQLIDNSQPDIVDNRQVMDYTATGPTLTLPLDAASYINLSAEFGSVSFKEFGALKQDRNSLNFSYRRLLNRRISATFQSSFLDVDSDSVVAPDYKIVNYSGQLEFDSDDLVVTAKVGANSLDRGGISTRNPIFSIDMIYRINSRLELLAEFGESVEDLLSDLRSPSVVDQSFANTDIEFDGNFGSTNSANIYVRTERSIGATYTESSRYTIGIRYSNNERSNIGLMREERDERVSANLNVPINTSLSLNASIERSTLEIAFNNILQERKIYRLGAAYRINNQLSLVFSAMDTDQKGSGLFDSFSGANYLFGISFSR